MLINLLLQISTNPHLSFVCTSFHSLPFNFNCNSHHWLLLPGTITLAVEKQDESRGYTVIFQTEKKQRFVMLSRSQNIISIRKTRWEIHSWGVGVEIFFFFWGGTFGLEIYPVSGISRILGIHTYGLFLIQCM